MTFSELGNGALYSSIEGFEICEKVDKVPIIPNNKEKIKCFIFC